MIEKDDIMTRFWYTLKNLHPSQVFGPKHEHPKQLNDTKYNEEFVLFQRTHVHHYLV
jgi:hypothetical protein